MYGSSKGSRSSKGNIIFSKYSLEPDCVIPLFHPILTEEYISPIILVILGYHQGEEVNFKVNIYFSMCLSQLKLYVIFVI